MGVCVRGAKGEEEEEEGEGKWWRGGCNDKGMGLFLLLDDFLSRLYNLFSFLYV